MIDQRLAPAGRAIAATQVRQRRLALLLGGAVVSAAILMQSGAAHAQDAPAHAAAPAHAERSIHDIDPFQKVNRGFFKFHNFLDKILIRPAAMVYRALTPGPIGKAVHNFLTNIEEPAVALNDVAQLRFKRAGQSGIRLVANTLAGFGGLMDVAGKAGIPFHDNGFAITMGRYGVGPGPYLFIPMMGPSSVRDAIGTFVDFTLDPIKLAKYPHRTEVSVGLTGLQGLDLRSRSDADLNALYADAVDPYATLRSAYLQNQQNQIDGKDDANGAALPEFESIPSEPAQPGADQGAPPAEAAPPPPAEPTPAPQGAPEPQPAPPPGPVSLLDPPVAPRPMASVALAPIGETRSARPVELIEVPPAHELVLAQAEAPAWR